MDKEHIFIISTKKAVKKWISDMPYFGDDELQVEVLFELLCNQSLSPRDVFSIDGAYHAHIRSHKLMTDFLIIIQFINGEWEVLNVIPR